jgi:signal transduction histidine kinase
MTRRWLPPATLRIRVSAVAALAVLLVLSVASAGLVLAQRDALTEVLDEAVDRQADELEARLDAGRSVDGAGLSDDLVVEVVDADGTRLAASRELEGDLLAGAQVPEGESPVTVDLPALEEDVRVVVRDVDGISVRVAGSLDDVHDGTAALTRSLLIVVPLSTAVLAVIVWWAVGRTLRPVEAMRARVDAISGAHLDQRVPEPRTADEIGRLARTMNAMLARLEESAERQRRFVGDASHELRSPLTRMRTELEVDRAHPETADPAGTADSVLAEIEGMQHLVDDLLLLARGDAGALPPADRGPVDVQEVVDDLVDAWRERGERRIDARSGGVVQVRGDRGQLERAVGNLLDNAVRHAARRVVVTVDPGVDGAVELSVHDDGPGVPPADRERVFERFTRLDDARSAGDGGAGLGLAIARDIAERHGGSLVLDPTVEAGARFVLRLPREPARGHGRVTGASGG